MIKIVKNKISFWRIIEIPLYIILLWSLVGTAFLVFDIIGQTALGIIGYVVLVIVYGLTAYNVLNSGKGLGYSVKAGAVVGGLGSLFSSVLNIVSLWVFPVYHNKMIQMMIKTAAERGAEIQLDQAKMFYSIGIYVGVLVGPIFGAVIGLAITVLIALILKHTYFKNKMTDEEKAKLEVIAAEKKAQEQKEAQKNKPSDKNKKDKDKKAAK